MITYVAFQRPVNLTQAGDEFWSASEMRQKHITCTDKNNHILFTYKTAKGVERRTKVPLTNIAYVSEEDDPKPEKKGEDKL
jgi:hypothetical protein